jgi:hypothetical protein
VLLPDILLAIELLFVNLFGPREMVDYARVSFRPVRSPIVGKRGKVLGKV